MQSRVILIGFMGSGKSTLGKRLARQLGYHFVDMDRLIEETASQEIPDIFSEHGEEVFRKWEHDIFLELRIQDKIVIATGGGAPCHGEMMKLMNESGATVYLEMSPAALLQRLKNSRTERPLLEGKSEQELLRYIRDTLKDRESYYKQAAFIIEGINPNLDLLVKLLS